MSKIEHLTDRAVLRLSGDDRRAFLQGLITQDISQRPESSAIFAALLTPQGKILFDFFVLETVDDFLIDCHKDAAPALLKRLSLYKLRAKVSISEVSALSVLASEHEITKYTSYADPRLTELGWRAITTDYDEAVPGDYASRRIALGVPEFGADFTSDEVFLTDVNYDCLNGVSYKKGCFIGQEVTSRMKRKGDIRRRTFVAEFEGAPPEKGAAVTAGASTLGEILSSAGNIALAQIRLDRLEKAQADQTPISSGDQALHLRFPDYLK